MTSTVLSAWLVLVVAALQQSDEESRRPLARVFECVRAGLFDSAVEEAEREPDPLQRAQGMLYALHLGGDLAGALRAGIAGLESAPEDSWLLERVVYIALSLRETALAVRYGATLEAVVAKMPDGSADRVRLQQFAREYAQQILEVRNLAEERKRALLRARVTLAIGLLAAAAVSAALARRSC